MLFTGVISLIILLTALLCFNGNYNSRHADGTVPVKIVIKEESGSIESVVDSLNISVASQGFVIALFPIYSSMSRQSRPHVMKSVTAALLFTMSTYTYLSFVSISYFKGKNVQPSIFNNIKEEEGLSPILLQCLFLLIFFCNIPFVFFAGKIALMAVLHQCCYSKKPEINEELLNADNNENDRSLEA